MKPWREIAKPHTDVLRGTFQQSEFAADLTRVYKGEASAEYQDAEKFFERTYLTGGMKDLVVTVARRMSGEAGEPVVNLLTNFGGGKTHTLLAVYHLLARNGGLAKFQGIRALLEENGLSTIPKAKVAVIDGTDLAPNQPREEEGLVIRTLWGLLAWQLLGCEGYEMVRGSDESGTAPGKAVLVELLRKAAPCAILMDELVAFERQIVASPNILAAGSFEANTSFFQALTESVKAVEGSMVLAALPASDVEVSGEGGKAAFEMLGKVFGRVNSVWRPGTADEGFEIVRRRLFSEIRDEAGVDETCRAFADFYVQHGRDFPPETREARYLEDLRKSYPIHPEVFERLYTDWSTLPTFQRTRGVLQYMALVIHRLWNDNHLGAMIMPGDLPLADKAVQDKSVHYLPDGWPAVVDREADGDRSEPEPIDSDPRFGAVQAAHRTARTIFLGSAASNRRSGPRGLTRDRILLGAVVPGQSPSTYSDVLDRLVDRLQYLFTDNGRYWLDTHPNLRREMEMRSERVTQTDIEDIAGERLLLRLCGRGHMLSAVHVFTPHADIPDLIDNGPRLVVLGLAYCYSAQDPRQAFDEAKVVLERHGDRPREKRNRLFFLAADFQRLGNIRSTATAYLAWHSIVTDITQQRMMTIDLNQKKQAEDSERRSLEALDQALRDGFRWLLDPVQKGDSDVDFQVERLGAGTESIALRAEKVLQENEWMIPRWASGHLRDKLTEYYFKGDVAEVPLKKLWNDFATFYYLPRLVNESVLEAVVREGVRQGLFGFAAGKDREEYLDFVFRRDGFSFAIQGEGFLIERSAAEAWQTAHGGAGGGGTSEPGGGANPVNPVGSNPVNPGGGSQSGPAGQLPKRYYGSCATGGLDFLGKAQDIQNEILRLFAGDPNAQITVSVDINVESRTGFGQEVVRPVKENANTLGFRQSSFE